MEERFDQGAFVVTADYRIQSHDRPGVCLAGGMVGAQPEQLLAAQTSLDASFVRNVTDVAEPRLAPASRLQVEREEA